MHWLDNQYMYHALFPNGAVLNRELVLFCQYSNTLYTIKFVLLLYAPYIDLENSTEVRHSECTLTTTPRAECELNVNHSSCAGRACSALSCTAQPIIIQRCNWLFNSSSTCIYKRWSLSLFISTFSLIWDNWNYWYQHVLLLCCCLLLVDNNWNLS